MNHKLIEHFLENTEKLGLLADVHLEGTYAEFTSSIMATFAKTKSGDEISTFLIELFLMPISSQLATGHSMNEGTLDPLARSFFSSCSRFFETSLGAYFSLSSGNLMAYPAIKGQYQEYLRELKQKEEERIRRHQEEQQHQREQAQKQEEERIRSHQEEQQRQSELARKQDRERIHLQHKENKAVLLEWLKSRARQLSYILFLGIPLFMQGFVFFFDRGFASMDSELNKHVTTFTAYGVTVFALYVICAIVFIIFAVSLTEIENDQDGEGIFFTMLWVFIFMIYQANNVWSDIPNHTKTVLVISICAVPFIPFFRVATALYGAGKIGGFVFSFLCPFLAMVPFFILKIVVGFWAWTTQDIKTADPTSQNLRTPAAEQSAMKVPNSLGKSKTQSERP
jgi:hypothetical protein